MTDDFISRQAAIEALDGNVIVTSKESVQAVMDYIRGCADRIRSLPSAQPEQRWIPCSERLPDDDRTKVVTLANGNAEAGYYSNGDWWCIGDTISLENPIVIAWMPLPEPPEVEDNETD